MNFYESLDDPTPIIDGTEDQDENPYDQPRFADDDDNPEDESPDEPKLDDEDEEEDEPEPTPIPAPVSELPDPGVYEPKDYSFQVTLYDQDGQNPKPRTIKSIEDWEQILETDPNLGNSLAVNRAFRQAQKMESGLERDKQDYDQKKQAFDQSKQQQEAQAAYTDQLQAELDYLVAQGDLPPIAKADKTADWSEPEIAKKEGVKAQMDLIRFMDQENKTRTKAGLKPMTSLIDAHNAKSRRDAKQQKSTTTAQHTQARRQAGARIASAAPAPVSSVPKGISVGKVVHLNDL